MSENQIDGVTEATLADLLPDPDNARLHNPKNIGMIADSLQEVGAWRSIAIDEHNVVIAGNGTVEAMAQAHGGNARVRIIEAEGDELIAVRRSGLTEEQKKRYGLLDNKTTDESEFDVAQVLALANQGVDVEGIFTEREMEMFEAAAKIMAAGEVAVPESETPETFKEYGEDVDTEYCCPSCRYKWSGKPK